MNNPDLIKVSYDSFAAGEIPGMLGSLSEDNSRTEAAGFPFAGTDIGPKCVLENMFAGPATESDRFGAKPEWIVDGRDTLVVFGTYRGTSKKTGKSTSVGFAHIYDLSGSKIVKLVEHMDTANVAGVLH